MDYRMNVAMAIWGALCAAETSLWETHFDDLLQVFADGARRHEVPTWSRPNSAGSCCATPRSWGSRGCSTSPPAYGFASARIPVC